MSLWVTILLVFPFAYFVIAYVYLASWHERSFLWDTLIHENGRLTLLGSLFYFDHFVALVPMITIFSLCTVGGFALAGPAPASSDASRAASIAVILLAGSVSLVMLACLMSIYAAGWQRTLDYALQSIERDGVMSKGGNWHQLQLSNIPIALGAIGLSNAFVTPLKESNSKRESNLIPGGIACISVAAALSIGVSILCWNGWEAFSNPRWLAHSIREIATFPLTGIPIALTAILLVEYYLSGSKTWVIQPGWLSMILIGIAVAGAAGQLAVLMNVDVLAHAQRPAFAPQGLTISYLLLSHVFEHFLDFVLIGPLTGGIYALVRFLRLKRNG